MLPKNRRIPRDNFTRILSHGIRFNSSKLLLYLDKMPENNPSRVAFSVSKKVCSKAVDRNRYRRIGYSVVSKFLSNIKSGYFLFFVYKKGSIPVKFSILEKEIEALLSGSCVLE